MSIRKRQRRKPDVCLDCPLYKAPMVRGEGKLEGLGLVIMGEAPGKHEVRQQRPFVGDTGRKVLNPILEEHLKLNREGIYITNSLLCQLDKNVLKESELAEAVRCCNRRREAEEELRGAKFIVGMGGTAARALIDDKVVGSWRGAKMSSPFGPCLITYHPTYVLRGKKTMGRGASADVYFQVIFQDLLKAYRMVDPSRPETVDGFQPACWETPPLDEAIGFLNWIRQEKTLWCVDVETDSIDPLGARLTILGFGAVVDDVVTAMAVPVWEGTGYDPAEFAEFMDTFAATLADPDVPTLFHNFSYDVTVCERHGMPTRGKIEDTLIAHYCLYPELPHDLQFVATSYLHVGPWKTQFRRRQAERTKQTKALDRWETKLQEATEGLVGYDEFEALVGKKLATAFAEKGLPEEELKVYKKSRTTFKRATKKVDELRIGIGEIVYEGDLDELAYNANDVACTLGTWLQMQEDEGEELQEIQKLYETDIAVGEIARRMQLRGLPVIGDARSEMQANLGEQIRGHYRAIIGSAQDAVNDVRDCAPELFDGRFDLLRDPDNNPKDLDPVEVETEWNSLTAREQGAVNLADVLNEGFSATTPAHKSWLLDALGVPVDEVTAKTGQRKMTKDNLVKYQDEYPAVKSLLDYSTAHKLLSTFVEGKKIVIGEDGRIHPSWNVKGSTNPGEYGTVTGRWTSEPNVQNWPYSMRTMIGFREDDPWTLIGADYSQLEFRILALFSGETALVQAFNEGPILILDESNPRHAALLAARKQEKEDLKAVPEELDVDGMDLRDFEDVVPVTHRDLWSKRILRVEKNTSGQYFLERDIHSNTAVTIFGNDYTRAPLKKYKLLRNLTKRATYGGMYGGNAETLYKALHRDFPGVHKERCEFFLETFDRIWPNIVAWRKSSHDLAVREGILKTPILGRARLFPLRRPETTVAYNWPIQATAADIMNTRLKALWDYVRDSEYRGRAFPIIQVHDAIYWEVHTEIAEEFRVVVEEQLSCVVPHNAIKMQFPVEAKIGKVWSET